MKQEWSRSWIASVQPRKQRKYRYEAPLHVRHAFLSAHLSKALRESLGRRALPLRKGDEVLVMRGGKKGLKGLVDRADLKRGKVYLDSIKVKKKDGTEVAIPLDPSNLLITRLNLEDKMRKAILERKKGRAEGKVPEGKEKQKKPAKANDQGENLPDAERKPGAESSEEGKEAKAEGPATEEK